MSDPFDYQHVVFAGSHPRRGDRDLGGLRLDRALSVLEKHRRARTGRILEAGCGVGRFSVPLAAGLPGARLTAFDVSHAAVAAAAAQRSGVGYLVADALVLPFAAGQFDAVVFFDLLEHLEHPAAALGEFARVTRPGGLLHGYVPCEGQPPTLHWLLGRWVHRLTGRHAGHVRHLRHAELAALLRQAGFAVLDISYGAHLLGQGLDIATFAAREVVFRRQRRDDRPPVRYDRSVLGGGRLGTVYGRARRVVEGLTYVESRLLGRCPWAVGVHVTAQRVSDGQSVQHRL